MGWLLRFLPEEQRLLVILGQRILSHVDTPEERAAVIQHGVDMLADGRVSVGEWSKFGKKLGILTGRIRPFRPAAKAARKAQSA